MTDTTEFVALIADMHLAPPETAGIDKPQSPEDLPARRDRRLESVLAQLAAGPAPAAVIVGGDCSNEQWFRPDYADHARQCMKRFPAPCCAVPGNHDVGHSAGGKRFDPAEVESATAAFRADWGGPWALDAAGFRFLGINTQLFGTDSASAREQARWLKEQLGKRTNLLRAVIGHTPPYFGDLADDFDDGTELMMLPEPARSAFHDALITHPPDLLITAHTHRFFVSRHAHWDWLGLPSTALGQDELWIPTDHFPPGDDHVGWLSLRRDGAGWNALMHYCGE